MNHLKSTGFKRGAVIAVLTTSLAGLVMLAVFVGCDEAAEDPLPDEPSALVEPDQNLSTPGMPEVDSRPKSDAMPPALRAAFIKSRQEEAGPEFAISTSGKIPVAINGRHHLRAELESDSVRILPMKKNAEWAVEMRLASVERGEQSGVVQRATRTVERNRVDYQRGDITEWYLNGPVGFEQGFTIEKRPLDNGGDELRLNIEVNTELTIENRGDDELVLKDEDGATLLWAHSLIVLDRKGEALPARFELADDGFAVVVDDSNAVYPIEIDPVWTEQKMLTASDAEPDDRFGYSVSINGNTAIVGARREDTGAFDAGAAYVFERDQGGTNNWGESKKLMASDAQASDWFGDSVSISGNTAIVGADGEDTGALYAGAVYIFERDHGGFDNWGEVTKIMASDTEAYDYFGGSVSISGDTIIVGAQHEDTGGSSAGAAYVFDRDQGGADNWGQVQKLIASDAQASDYFGRSVSISGDTAIVGAYGEDTGGSLAGAAYVFDRDQGGADNWGQVQKLIASDAQAGYALGDSVSIGGDTTVVGASGEDTGGDNSGAAYVFDRDQGGADNWGQVKKITASDAHADDYFGIFVSIGGDTAIVGASGEDTGGDNSGAAYVFERDQGGTDNWGEVKKLMASNAQTYDGFGRSVSISGDTTIVGARYESTGGSSAGAAYVFEFVFLPDGEECTADTDCLNSHCVDGVCCNIACGGNDTDDCQACSIAAGATTDGVCENLTGTTCDDGSFCNGTETCTTGVCGGSSTGDPCDGPDGDSNCAETCDEIADNCLANDTDGSACDDGSFCNGTEICTTGVCGSSTGNPCNGPDGDGDCTESCNETSDNCTANDTNGSICDDGSFCNGTETCTTGVCGSSTGYPCTGPDGDGDCAESCDETSDNCTANDTNGSSCDDGSFCNGTETCTTGVCGSSSGDPCDGPDGDWDCSETCNETADNCTANDTDGTTCNDGLFCNGTEICTTGVCGSSTGNPCDGPDGDGDCAETCDETADNCLANDTNGSACDDGSFCNGTETCTTGVCGSSTGYPCTGPDGDGDCAESCDETADDCTGPDTTGSSCDDGLFCTVTDACDSAGSCVGTGNPCPGPDGDINCVESCDEAFDNCIGNDANGTPCNDGLFCTATDTCNGAGSCVGMGDPCPGPDGDGDCVESCKEIVDDCTENDPNGSSCDDGNATTIDDQCTSGVCDGTASDTDTDTDTDTDSDTDTDADTDTDTDTDSDTDTDTSADAGTGNKDDGGCGCRAAGTGGSGSGLLELLFGVSF